MHVFWSWRAGFLTFQLLLQTSLRVSSTIWASEAAARSRASERRSREGPKKCRLRVVSYFSSGIIERAKRERAWKSPHAWKGDARGEREKADLVTERHRQLTTARTNQTKGLANGRAANWGPEVVFSPFCALSRRQQTSDRVQYFIILQYKCIYSIFWTIEARETVKKISKITYTASRFSLLTSAKVDCLNQD